jgi:hypothetical protein
VFGDDEGHATLAMLEAERDLRNAAPLAALPFVGEAHAVTMAGLVQDQRHGDPSRRVIGSIRYRFEPDGGVLLKQTWPYPAETPGDGDGIALVEELEAFTCRYYEPREAQWLDAWADPSNLPARVAIELSCTSGAARIVLRQEIVLPLGGVAADEDEDADADKNLAGATKTR